VYSLEGAALQGVSPRFFPNLRRMHEYRNLPLHKQLSFYFLTSFLFGKKKISMGTYKIGGAPQHNTLGFFFGGRTIKIHIEIIKRELIT
jgi:hypothetical protein